MTDEVEFDTTPARSSIALIVGIALLVLLILVELGTRYRGAVGVFSAEEWLVLLPDFHGRLFDYMLGLGVGVGLWAVLHHQNKREVSIAIPLGGLAIWLAPQIFAQLYVWRLFGAMNSEIAFDSLVRSLPYAIAGAFVAGFMWRIAYRRTARVT